MTYPLDAATRASRRAAFQRTYERECAERRLSILTEEFPRMAIILPVPVDPADGPAAPDLEDSARRAFGLDEGDARSDAEARLASRVLLTVLGILFALACLALLLALVNWGKP